MKNTTATAKASRATRILIQGLVTALGDAEVRSRAVAQMAYHAGAAEAHRNCAAQADMNDQATLATIARKAAAEEEGKRAAWKDYAETDPKVLADQAAQA